MIFLPSAESCHCVNYPVFVMLSIVHTVLAWDLCLSDVFQQCWSEVSYVVMLSYLCKITQLLLRGCLVVMLNVYRHTVLSLRRQLKPCLRTSRKVAVWRLKCSAKVTCRTLSSWSRHCVTSADNHCLCSSDVSLDVSSHCQSSLSTTARSRARYLHRINYWYKAHRSIVLVHRKDPIH